MKKVTLIQESVYEFIKEFLIENHGPPTNVEIAAYMGWSSANAANGHVKALCKKGLLEPYNDGTGKYRLAGIDIRLIKRRKK